MTLEDLIRILTEQTWLVAVGLLVPPLLALLLGFMHNKEAGTASPWKYAYAVLLYAACVPGMFASVLTGYTLFFRNESLLKVNMAVYFLPIALMALTLFAVRRNVESFDRVPGFGRLSGLMIILAVSFAVAFALHRLRFGIFFFGPLVQLLVIAVIVFALLQWGASRLAGRGTTKTLDDIIRDD